MKKCLNDRRIQGSNLIYDIFSSIRDYPILEKTKRKTDLHNTWLPLRLLSGLCVAIFFRNVRKVIPQSMQIRG